MSTTSIAGHKVQVEPKTIDTDDVYAISGEGAPELHAACSKEGLNVSPLKDGCFHILRAVVLLEIQNSETYAREYICTGVRAAALNRTPEFDQPVR